VTEMKRKEFAGVED